MTRYEKLYTQASVWSAIFQMAVPALVVMLLMVFYNMADMIFVGQLGSTAMVASISIVSPLFSLLMAVATMVGFGGCTYITNALGAGNLEKAKEISSVSFWFSLLFSLLLIPVLLLLRMPLLSLLGATEDTLPFASRYYAILTLGAPFMVLSTMMGSIIRSEGAIRESMLGNITGTITNLVLDPLFILAFHFGVSGAAAATVLGNAVATLVYALFTRKSEILAVSPGLAARHFSHIGMVLALGLPNAVSTILSGFASSFSNNLLKAYGTDAIAAMAAAGKTSLVITMLIMGICMGCQPLLAYSYGAGDEKRLGKILQDLLLLTTLIGIGAAAGCFFGRVLIIHLFLKDPSAASLAESLVPWLVVGSPFIGIYYLSTNYLQASQKAGSAIVLSVLRQGVILIAALYVFNRLFGFHGIAMSHMVSDIASEVIAAIWLFRVRHRARPVSSPAAQPDTI